MTIADMTLWDTWAKNVIQFVVVNLRYYPGKLGREPKCGGPFTIHIPSLPRTERENKTMYKKIIYGCLYQMLWNIF